MTCFITAFHGPNARLVLPLPSLQHRDLTVPPGKTRPLFCSFRRRWWLQGAACFLEFGQQRKGIRGSPGFCFPAQVTGS